MKLCIIMIGVSRPSSNIIIKNINNNILYFKSAYPNHTFDFIVCTYINESYSDILNYCITNKITSCFIEPIKDSDIPKELILPPPNNNRYRMFYSMNYILNKISNIYDGVIRLRIDTEIKSFEIMENIKPNNYYTAMQTNKSCSDNIGYATLEVMKNVWKFKNCFMNAFNNETLLFNAIIKNSYSIQEFKFHYILYQNNSEFFNGVQQWSKGNREWKYDGNNYINGDRLD